MLGGGGPGGPAPDGGGVSGGQAGGRSGGATSGPDGPRGAKLNACSFDLSTNLGRKYKEVIAKYCEDAAGGNFGNTRRLLCTKEILVAR